MEPKTPVTSLGVCRLWYHKPDPNAARRKRANPINRTRNHFTLHTTQAQALSHGAMAREGHAKVFIFINIYKRVNKRKKIKN